MRWRCCNPDDRMEKNELRGKTFYYIRQPEEINQILLRKGGKKENICLKGGNLRHILMLRVQRIGCKYLAEGSHGDHPGDYLAVPATFQAFRSSHPGFCVFLSDFHDHRAYKKGRQNGAFTYDAT